MGIKANNQQDDIVNDNPLVASLFNYNSTSTSIFPPPGSKFMITEILEEIMITESGDFMITEF